MKRKLKWLAIVLAVSLLGFGTALLLWPRDRITAESWQKIQIGMTEEEVAEVLHGPGLSVEEYENALLKQTKPRIIDGVVLREPGAELGLVVENMKIWIGQRGGMEIQFERGHVIRKSFYGFRPTNFIDRLRDWFGL